MTKKVQTTVMLTSSVYNYVDEMSKELGMSKSAYINMVIVNHKRGNSILDSIPGLAEELKKEDNK